ncbi:MAG TPA: carboxy terminal-processing peptidase [Dokdonella sp.]|uniref:carboxy terminal-processing peptidase n=1 Tax=Dokdonella sp. TaxID=2291710 RepID=UPI0025C3E95E|nr:carboxy terminal-processing peptidase [Dokdonella sp.]MBX3690679.1 carboxy terminal-processing peptidase [Dokdonella sp.]MCW5567755.1 carboxy terminal-processing peptidase [Dokdonella sp.]HNR92063.1 carboxy terminal-processing peptidase [Dokdonella sp.]
MRRIVLSLALVTALGTAVAKPAETASAVALKPTSDQAEAAIWAMRFLSRFHYKPVPLDDAMSEKIFDAYLDSLDGEHLFFTQADIDGFAATRDKLDDAIYERDLGAPFAMFAIYQQRAAERLTHARELLAKPFDFSKDESYAYDRAKAPWPKDRAELDELWRLRVKNDWLRLKLAGKADKDIRETLDKRYSNYLDRTHQLNGEDVFQTFMNAYAMSIEPHTNYLSPRASQNFDIAMRLSLEGIGAVLQRQDEYTAIREIIPGGPAAIDGRLKPGDRVLAVGQGTSGPLVDVIGWRLDDVVDKIRGAKGTVVRLEILPETAGPDGKHETLTLTRNKVNVEEQAAKKSVIDVKQGDATRRVGVISLPTFYQDFDARRRGEANYRSATRDVERLLGELREEKVDGVIVDLRNNGGGSLDEATDLTGLFIDKGPVVQIRETGGRVEVKADSRAGSAWNGPLAVLVNRASASASEIFAAAIQDYGRGIVIGEPTFGKGTVQNLLSMDDMARNEKQTYGNLKMTVQQFFRIDGGSTQLRGVTPDINFPSSVGAEDYGESSYDNALPWTSIAKADYSPVANLKPLVPMLVARHDARTSKDTGWRNLAEEIADAKKLREKKTISLNEDARIKERNEQEARRKAREAALAGTAIPAENPVTRATTTPEQKAADAVTEGEHAVAATEDDGLQADERSISSDLKREQERKARRDVVLNEAANILIDQVDLIRNDTQLAARIPVPKVDATN